MTVGASMLAITRSRPPQRRQVSISMEKTRLGRCTRDTASGARGARVSGPRESGDEIQRLSRVACRRDRVVGNAFTDYTQFLDADALKGARIGVWREFSFEVGGVPVDQDLSAIMDDTIAAFETAGAMDQLAAGACAARWATTARYAV
jgi:hypothetical protein